MADVLELLESDDNNSFTVEGNGSTLHVNLIEPQRKVSKRKIAAVVGVIAALMLVVSMATAYFITSNREQKEMSDTSSQSSESTILSTFPSTLHSTVSVDNTSVSSTPVSLGSQPSTTTSIHRLESDTPSTKRPESPNNPYWSRVTQMFVDSIDTSIDPCTDFYQYSCNKWIENLPSNASSEGTFEIVNKETLDAIGETFASVRNGTAGAWIKPVQQAQLAWEACMSSNANDSNGTELVNLIKQYGGWPMLNATTGWSPDGDALDISSLAGRLAGRHAIATFLTPIVSTDWKHPENQMLALNQATLSYPTIYYTLPSLADTFVPALGNYIVRVAIAICKAHDNSSYNSTYNSSYNSYHNSSDNSTYNSSDNCDPYQIKRDVDDMISLERDLAAASVPDSQQRNYSQMYNVYSVQEASKTWPNISWSKYLAEFAEGSQVPADYLLEHEFIVQQSSYVGKLNTILSRASPRVLHNYLIWRLIYTQSEFLPPIQDALLQFRRVVHGVESLRESEETCTSNVLLFLPYLVGRIYIDHHFSRVPDARNAVRDMSSGILAAFREMISQLPWMTPSTKLEAFSKVDQMVQTIGYPDWIMDDTELERQHPVKYLNILPSDQWFTVEMKLTSFVMWSWTSKLLSSTDRKDFGSSPAEVNAWYQPSLNSISIPAGILNPPFFHPKYPAAVNYGLMGTILGHELTHAFDDDGVQWTSNGTLGPWMDSESFRGFQDIANCVIKEYDAFTFANLPNLPSPYSVNGVRTQGENIADNGGIKASYLAFKKQQTLNGVEPLLPAPMDTYSWDQIFFLSFAQTWCSNSTASQLKNQLLTDSHSPGMDRVLGTVRNLPEFAAAFHCPEGAPMAPKVRCNVW